MRYITVEGLSFQYDAEPVLDNIHYHLDSGEFVTLTGENGAAKSTLIKATLGILKPKKGIVTISDINKDGKKLRMAYLPQQIASFNAGFPSTVYEFVKSGRYPLVCATPKSSTGKPLHHRGSPLNRRNGSDLPSSLTRIRSIALVFST